MSEIAKILSAIGKTELWNPIVITLKALAVFQTVLSASYLLNGIVEIILMGYRKLPSKRDSSDSTYEDVKNADGTPSREQVGKFSIKSWFLCLYSNYCGTVTEDTDLHQEQYDRIVTKTIEIISTAIGTVWLGISLIFLNIVFTNF